MKSYDYANREGVSLLSWDDVENRMRLLTEAVSVLNAEVILGVARAGLYPATYVASALSLELFPIRLSRRVGGTVKHTEPVWHVPPPDAIREKRCVVIDEIADTGQTLAIAADGVRERGAASVHTGTTFAHSWADPMPDAVAEVSDALILFPWDAEVFRNGRWETHPELEIAVRANERDD